MSSEIQTSKTFEQRMFERIREQMGDLMTEEDLRKLVDTAMHKAFFEPTVVQSSGYYNSTPEVRPPLFISMIQKEVESKVRQEIVRWLEEHPEEVSKAIKETIEAGIFTMMCNHFAAKSSFPLQNLMSQLSSKGLI